jgi:hypothetical protein
MKSIQLERMKVQILLGSASGEMSLSFIAKGGQNVEEAGQKLKEKFISVFSDICGIQANDEAKIKAEAEKKQKVFDDQVKDLEVKLEQAKEKYNQGKPKKIVGRIYDGEPDQEDGPILKAKKAIKKKIK